MDMLGGFGIAMIVWLLITSIVIYWALRQYQAARAGLASLGPGLFLTGSRVIGGLVGIVLGSYALYRQEPGEWMIWIGVIVNVFIVLPILSIIVKK